MANESMTQAEPTATSRPITQASPEPSSTTNGSGNSPATPQTAAQDQIPSLVPVTGWHVLHLFYRIDQSVLARMHKSNRRTGLKQLAAALDAEADDAPTQMHSFAMVGHKGDFGLVAADPDILKLHRLQNAIRSSDLGAALVLNASFYSLTEISEYVPSVERYAEKLKGDGAVDPNDPTFQAKLKNYERRLTIMNRQRLTPEFPDWPCLCFYPMNKLRQGGDQNWFLLDFEERDRMMAEHGKSGMQFAGRVIQVITTSTGLDDWEWGVTLWATNPAYLKEIVYTMRFDRASAQYAQFGEFYFGFRMPTKQMLDVLRVL